MRSSRLLARVLGQQGCRFSSDTKAKVGAIAPNSKPSSPSKAETSSTGVAHNTTAGGFGSQNSSATSTGSSTVKSVADKPPSSSAAVPPSTPSSSTPSSPPAGSGKAPNGKGKNEWLLHPLVPIDVRLLGTGLLGIAALYFYTTTSKTAPPKPTWDQPTQEPAEDFLSDSSRASHGASSSETPEQVLDGGQDTATEPEGASAEPMGTTESTVRSPTEQKVDTIDEKAEHVAPEDAAKVVALLNDVLAGGSTAVEEKQSQTIAALPEEPKSNVIGEPSPVTPSDANTESSSGTETDGQPGASAPHQQKEGPFIPDFSDLFPPRESSPPAAVAPPASAAIPQPQPDSTTPEASAPSTMKSHQVVAATLIQKSNDLGVGPGDNWNEFKARQKQAEADVHVLNELLGQLQEEQRKEIEAVQHKVAAAHQRIAELERQATRKEADFAKVLMQERALLEEKREAELAATTAQLKHQFARVLVKERTRQAKEADEVRLHVNALSKAFSRRSEESKSSHIAHKIALGTFALEGAIQGGRPFAAELDTLRQATNGDPLVTCALSSVPAAMVPQGIPTEQQLLDSFKAVKRVACELALVPEGGSTLITATIAKLAAKLKVSEPVLVDDAPKGGISAAMARAEAKLLQGNFLEAAEIVQNSVKGTAAARQVQGWVAQVHARAKADQAVQLLQAKAISLAASLS